MVKILGYFSLLFSGAWEKRESLLASCYGQKARKNVCMFPLTFFLLNMNYTYFSDSCPTAHVPASLNTRCHYIKYPVSLPATLLCFTEAHTVAQERASAAKNQCEQEYLASSFLSEKQHLQSIAK